MKYDRTCSASGMFVANNVMSFNEIWRKSLYNFKQRVTKSNNIIVNHISDLGRFRIRSRNQRTNLNPNPDLIPDSDSCVVESDLESESCRFESESDSDS